MINIQRKLDQFRIVSMAVMVAIVISTVLSPLPVEATCIENGNTTTCDGDNDAVTNDPAAQPGEHVTDVVTGNDGNDLIYGANADAPDSSATETLEGGEGNDTIQGGNATTTNASVDNTIDGGPGNDTLLGGNGYGSNSAVNNNINGGEGDDYIHPGTDRLTTNNINGGAGNDTVDYSYVYGDGSTGDGVTVDLSNPNPQQVGVEQSTDTISGVENLVGTVRDDKLTGTTDANTISAGKGNDVIVGNGGNDKISAGDGNDQISVHDGQFSVAGEGGDDTITVSGQLGSPAQPAMVDGGSGTNLIQFLANTFGSISLTTDTGQDTLDFSKYNSTVTIDLSNTTSAQHVGGEGDASLWITLNGLYKNVIGAIGFSNVLTGNGLDNTLTGGNQNDSLNGGGGQNTLNGGNGVDTDAAATPVAGGIVNQSGSWLSIEQPAPLPAVTETPGATETPLVTETPAATEPPVVTETPVATETSPATGVPTLPETPVEPTSAPTDLLLAQTQGGAAPQFIPVTGGVMKLAGDPAAFQLPNGNTVTVSGLSGEYWVSIQDESGLLPTPLPAGQTLLSGINVQIFQGADASHLTPVTTLPAGASIQLNFLLKDASRNIKFLMLGSTGEWLELGNGHISGQRYSVSTQQSGTAVITAG